MENISYSGVILDRKSHIELLNALPIGIGWKGIAHHLTICLGPLPEDWKSRIGEQVELRGKEFGRSDKAFALKIDNFQRILPGTPHITIAINPTNNGKPKDSNDITNWGIVKYKNDLVLTGTIQEIPFD